MKRQVKKTSGFTLVELMVVIVIVGILTTVAIPKFLDASHQAKASEFPTQLTAIYTGQLAYQAEKGGYVTTFACLKDSAGVDVPSSSKWFTYYLSSTAATCFTGSATVKAPGFGQAASTDWAAIDQANSKTAASILQKYCPNWR